jgi:hypothetical protein
MQGFSGIVGWPAGVSETTRTAVAARYAVLPVAGNGQARSGFHARSFFDDYYNRIHVAPTSIDAGIVASPRIYSGEVWNAYFTTKSLTSIDLQTGIALAGITTPSVFAALGVRTFTITVDSETGPTAINWPLQFTFTDSPSLPILITGVRGVPWPFLPRSELIEACVWLTDVSQSYDTEERASLREIPLREFALTHIATDLMQTQARTLARRVRTILVPEWPRQVIGDAYDGASVPLPDGPVLVWRSETDYDQAVVTAGVMGQIARNSYGVRIMPLLVCRITDGWGNQRPAGKWAEMSLGVQTADGADDSDASLYPTYDGLSLVTDRVVIGSGSASEGVTWGTESIDNGIALPVDVRDASFAEERYTVRWYKSRADYPALRAWIYSRRGRWLAFWLPSWVNDVQNPERVGGYILADTYRTEETRLGILIGGTIYPRKVMSATLVSGRWQIQLDSAIPAGTIETIMYLRRVRFNADRIEFRHAAAEGVSVAVQCVQVPE